MGAKRTGIDAYIATGKGEADSEALSDDSEKGIKKAQFTYHEEKDCFVCPAGHNLALKSSGSDGTRIYQAKSADCDGCAYRGRCCKSKTGEPRKITTEDKEPLRQAMHDKMKQTEGRILKTGQIDSPSSLLAG
ncbi:MAG TPA: hypothetical protein DCR81_04795 [Smithella sp.]|nr:hypothetical protein [Smithella sp.]